MTVEVKICGLSTAQTVEGAIAAGADFIGLVFFPPSPRHVDLNAAQELAERARGRAKIVAVIVDASDQLVQNVARYVRPDFFQAHGHEEADRVSAIKRITGIPVIKAIRVLDAPDVALAREYREAAEMIMFDAKAPAAIANALPGGNGAAFDWSLLGREGTPKRFVLSGGLTPDNVAQAIRATAAPIVDVSSGVESSPGIKDLKRIQSFIAAARAMHSD
jgi:phosphoribosylanthranilate isomerase